MRVSQLTAADASEYIELRRRAIVEEPLAFLASPDDDATSSIKFVEDQLSRAPNSVVFGAFAERLVGMLGVYREDRTKTNHKARVWGMYVLPDYRSLGIGDRLVAAVLDHVRSFDGLASVYLTVSDSATSAKRLYEKAGFQVWGIEPDAIRHDGISATEFHMRLEVT